MVSGPIGSNGAYANSGMVRSVSTPAATATLALVDHGTHRIRHGWRSGRPVTDGRRPRF
jgi:hypothetical protein